MKMMRQLLFIVAFPPSFAWACEEPPINYEYIKTQRTRYETAQAEWQTKLDNYAADMLYQNAPCKPSKHPRGSYD